MMPQPRTPRSLRPLRHQRRANSTWALVLLTAAIVILPIPAWREIPGRIEVQDWVPTGGWDSVATGSWDSIATGSWDGVATGSWDTFTTPQVPDGPISDLWLDAGERTLWVGSDGGLVRFDGHAWETIPHPDGLPLRVRALSGDGRGGLWVGSDDGLGHLSAAGVWSWLREADGLPHNQVTALAQDAREGLWVGTLRGVAHIPRGPDGPVDVIARTQRLIRDLAPAQEGGVWFALGAAIAHALPDTTVVEQYGADQGLTVGVQALSEMPGGVLWIGTEGGLYRLEGGSRDRQLQPMPVSADGEGEPTDILELVPDGGDGAWLGTASGLWHVDAQGHPLDGSPLRAAEDRLAANRVQAIARMADGTLWLGTSRGLNRWNPQAWRDLDRDGLARHPLAAQADRLWAITPQGVEVWTDGAWRFANEGPWPNPRADVRWFSNLFVNVSPERYAAASARLVAAVYGRNIEGQPPIALSGGAESLWLGTDAGAVFLAGDRSCTYAASDGLPDDRILTLHAEADQVWVGTDLGLGVGQAGPGSGCDDRWTWATVPLPTGGPSASVRAIDRGSDGSLWVASEEGLWRLPAGAAPGRPENWIHYTSADGLLSTRTNALWADDDGDLWVGTASGLNGLEDNSTLEKGDDLWVGLTAADGLVHNQVTALWRDAEGALWAETGSGNTALVRHSPSSSAPALHVTDDRSRLDWWRLEVGARFHAASLTAGELAYRYQLPGQPWMRTTESGWVQTAWTPPAGDTFELHAVDADLNRARLEGVSLDIPLWQRPWGWWWVRLFVYGGVGITAIAVAGQKPLGRWWRDRQRASYRETWEISFVQARPEYETCTVHAEQRLKQNLWLRIEQIWGRRPLRLGFSTPKSRPLPPTLADHHQAWLEKKGADQTYRLEALARELSSVLLPQQLAQILRTNLALPGHRLRLRLNFSEAPALAAYPWEVAGPPLLDHLGTDPRTAVSRWLPEEELTLANPPDDEREPLQPLERGRPLRLLLVAAAPKMPPAFPRLSELNIRREMARIQAVLQEQEVLIDVLLGDRADQQEDAISMNQALDERLRVASGAPDVVHFIGHAGRHPRKPEDDQIVLYMEGAEGEFMPLDAARLAEMVRTAQQQSGRPKLLVLNACQTASVDGGRTLAGLAPQLLTQTRLMAIVGTQYQIGDEASARFSSIFYQELIKTQPLDYAVSQARDALKDQLGGRDWAAPVLYMRVDDGMLYER